MRQRELRTVSHIERRRDEQTDRETYIYQERRITHNRKRGTERRTEIQRHTVTEGDRHRKIDRHE